MQERQVTKRKSKWVLKCGVLAATLVVCLLLAEFGARAILSTKAAAPPERWYRSNWKGKLCQSHPKIGRLHKRNVRVVVPNEFGQEVEILTDANGLRICDRREARSTRPAIAVLGDSFVEAAVTPCDESFCTALSREVGGSRVLNFGIGGYSTPQAVGLGRLKASEYDIRLFVLAVFAGNDLRDNYLWESRRNSAPTAPDSDSEYAIFRLLRSLRPQQRDTYFQGYNWRGFFDMELLLYDPQLSDEDRAKLDEAKSLSLLALRDFSALAEENGAPAFVVFVPTKAMVYKEPSFITSTETQPHAYDAIMQVSRRGFDFDQVRTIWQDLADEAELPFFDLTDAFREHRVEPLYGRMDRHWSATGQQLAAKLVAEYLCRQDPRPPLVRCE